MLLTTDHARATTSTKPRSGAGFLILPALIAIALITLAIVHPKASIWISQAVQAEFGGGGIADDMPVETATAGHDHSDADRQRPLRCGSPHFQR